MAGSASGTNGAHGSHTINKLRTMFDCAVCLEKFKDPRILPACGHQFCMLCIEGIAGPAHIGSVRCPTCRVVTTIKTGAKLTELTRPILMNQVQEMVMEKGDSQSVSQSCGLCKMKLAHHYCYECRECFCTPCFTKHSKAAAFQGHSTEDLHQVVFCPDHKTVPLSLYCLSCKTVICSTCTIGEHENHPTESVKTVAVGERDKLRTQLRLKEPKLKQCEKALENARHKKKEIMEKSILHKMHFEIIMESLRLLQIELKDNEAICNTAMSSNLDNVTSDVRILQEEYNEITGYCEASNRELQKDSDLQFLIGLKNIPAVEPTDGLHCPNLIPETAASNRSHQLLTELSTLVHNFPAMPKDTVVLGSSLDSNGASQTHRKSDPKCLSEMTDACLFMKVSVLLDKDFVGHQGYDLFDVMAPHPRQYDVRKTTTLEEFLPFLITNLSLQGPLRAWPITYKDNATLRPSLLQFRELKEWFVEIANEYDDPFMVFVETANSDGGQASLPEFRREDDILLFLKHYDPRKKTMKYCGHVIMPITETIGDFLVPLLCDRMTCPSGTNFMFFEEVRPGLTERIKDIDQPIEAERENLMNGDIIVFQEADQQHSQYECPTPIEYFRAYRFPCNTWWDTY